MAPLMGCFGRVTVGMSRGVGQGVGQGVGRGERVHRGLRGRRGHREPRDQAVRATRVGRCAIKLRIGVNRYGRIQPQYTPP